MDLTIVAGRRPDLLAATMDSFSRMAFSNLAICNVYANVDAIFGSVADERECQSILLAHFPNAEIQLSGQANFTRAVQSLWLKTSSRHVFHLEDDWIINEPIKDDLLDYFDGVTKQICFNCETKRWDGKSLFNRMAVKHLIGDTIGIRRHKPRFSTSPSLIDGPFARVCAGLMDLRFNPEKQFYKSMNPRLEEYVAPFRTMILPGKKARNLITDLGRDWLEARGVKKDQIETGGLNLGMRNYVIE